MVYHYTSLDALASIVQNGQLWLTRSEFLNDPLDCKLLPTLFQKRMDREIGEDQGRGDWLFEQWCAAIAKKHEKRERDGVLLDLHILYQNAPAVEYLQFLQEHIHLYVLSLTHAHDKLPMWNYYGSGGVELQVDRDTLVGAISNSLAALGLENVYLVHAPLLYIKEDDEAGNIDLTRFNASLSFAPSIGYEHTNLGRFFDAFLKGYLDAMGQNIPFLPENLDACPEEKEAFFRAVYKDQSKDRRPEFKFIKDRLLYFLALSALLKSDSYQHEDEYRVVVFQNSLEPSLPVKYRTHELNSLKYLRPHLELDVALDFIGQVTLSPFTRNLPIDRDLYCRIVADFLPDTPGTDGQPRPVAVDWSRHLVR